MKQAIVELLFLSALFLTACASGGTQTATITPAATSPTAEGPTLVPAGSEIRINRRVEVPQIPSYPQLLPFDGIQPIYEPEFASAAAASLQEDELVLAISLDGEARAYPVTVLRRREMVNDELAGIPILVTW